MFSEIKKLATKLDMNFTVKLKEQLDFIEKILCFSMTRVIMFQHFVLGGDRINATKKNN